jgi:hypothetical protein
MRTPSRHKPNDSRRQSVRRSTDTHIPDGRQVKASMRAGHSTLSMPDRSSSRSASGRLMEVCAELRWRGWGVDVVDRPGSADPEVHLRVRGSRDTLVVELFGPRTEAPYESCWEAIRIKPKSRVVWCGPPRACERAQLVRFVEDLMCRDVEELCGRYLRLG